MRNITVGTFETTPRMRELVNEVLDSGRISYGPMSRQFESQFADIHDCRFGVLSNSGTSSLQVALQALKELRGWEDGDEVIVPACTFVATANIVLHNRMRPVLVDVDRKTYNIDPLLIHKAITPRTKAIIPVHLFGQPCDMRAIRSIADAHNLAIIEDSCECMFATFDKRKAGSWGDVGCFSTYVAHLLTTGVGGISITNDPDLAAKMRSLVNHGRDGIYISIDDDDKLEGKRLSEVISRRFNFESVGHSFRITELESALAIAQLETWETMIATRQLNAVSLCYMLNDLCHKGHIQLPAIDPLATHSFMMLPIVAPKQDKWELCSYLEENGIETREMLRLTDQPIYKDLGLWNPEDYPAARWINDHGFYIGCHQGLTVDDMEYVSDVFHRWYR